MPDIEARPHLQQFFYQLSGARKSALLLDYDGTLSPFQLNRDEAVPYPGVPMLLAEIMDVGHTRVVIITGRRASEVVSLLGIHPHPEIWGAHGLQRLRTDGSCEMPFLDEAAAQSLLQADRWLDTLGVHDRAEHKPGSLAVHWREISADGQSDIRRLVTLGWLPITHRAGLVMQEFDGGMEIRLPGGNKGHAVRTVLEEMGPDVSAAYLGDDETDEDAFDAMPERGLRILVRPEWRESAADLWLRPPAELLVFLCDWLEACRSARRGWLRRRVEASREEVGAR